MLHYLIGRLCPARAAGGDVARTGWGDVGSGRDGRLVSGLIAIRVDRSFLAF